jgi:hypothetical protein
VRARCQAPALGLRAGTDGVVPVPQTDSRKEKDHVAPVQAANLETVRPRCVQAPAEAPGKRLEALEDRSLPSTLTGLNTHDSGPDSLRAAIAAAQNNDTIHFAGSLAGQTIANGRAVNDLGALSSRCSMSLVQSRFRPMLRLLAVALLGAVAGYGLRGVVDTAAPRPADSIPALVAHLQQHGIHLRVVPDARDGDVCAGAYLTRTSKNWEQLSFWLRIPEQLPHWEGTIHVKPEDNTQLRAELLANCKGGCLVYGQLLLFGDPDLIEEVYKAVTG